MRLFFVLFAVLTFNFQALAQLAGNISGTVQDQVGKPLAAVTVSLLKENDSSLVKVAITDKNGQYEFVQIPGGVYVLQFTSVGFEKHFTSARTLTSSGIQMPATILLPLAEDMEHVVVAAKKPFVETKLDKTIVNVEASPTSAGSTALEILEKSPGIMVNSDGAISLRGKQGVIVMIDGKPTYLSPADLANVLKNMPASALETIEIMTNPSSKYDASGNSGVINIKTKKGRNEGFNGSIMIGATATFYDLQGILYVMPRSQNSFNFNYKKGKINLFGNYNPNFLRGRNTMDLASKQIDVDDGLLKGYTNQQTRFRFANFNQTLKLGLDWYANKKNVFGIVASGFLFDGKPRPVTVANMSDVNHNLERRLISETKNNTSLVNFTGNLNWKHSFDSAGRELTADFDYVMYRNESNMFLTTDIYDEALQPIGHTELKGKVPVDIDIVSFKTDYVKPIKGGRFEAGLKTSFVRTDNLVNYETRSGTSGPWQEDKFRSNHFIYEENVNAAYVNATRQINKWTFQAGLRVENMNAKGDQRVSKQVFKRDTTNLFPTAFASYALSKAHTFTASYGRRILRPNYQDLNPFIFFLDTLSFRQGNIYLKPQYTHNVELSYAFKGRFIATLAYNNTDDIISQIIKPLEGSGGKIRYLTPDNVSRLKNISLSITAPVPVTSWWNLNFFGSIYNNHYTGMYDTLDIDLQFTSFVFNVTNTFTISKTMVGELSGFYRYKGVDQLTQTIPLYLMNVGLQKQVMKGKGTVRLNVRDPFQWLRFGGLNQYGYVDMDFRSRSDTRQVTATFSLRFGKQLQQQQRRRGSSQEEQNRVGGAGQ